MSWNYNTSTTRVQNHLDTMGEIEVEKLVRDADLHTLLSETCCRDIFGAHVYESLERQLDQSDFAIAIAQPDDIAESRGVSSPTPRDNVIFELGLFIGRIGRQRSFLVEPRGEEVKLPSDFSGITALSYRYDSNDLPAALGIGM